MIDIHSLRELLEHRQPGVNITIPKSIMQKPPVGCEETILGDLDGAYKQYRCDPDIHMLEYPDMYKAHKDRFDPRKNPLNHLIYDSPETLAAVFAGITAGFAVREAIYNDRKGKSENVLLSATIGGSAAALITGLVIYYIVKRFRHN
jgi:hypothetical protein